MDPILAALSPSLLALVEGSLSNDEVSSDEEMLEYFISNGLTEEQARQALTYRDQYLNNIYLDGFTPITAVDEALHFNPHTRQFEPDLAFFFHPLGQYLPQRAVLFPLIRGHHHARKHFFHHAVPHRRMPGRDGRRLRRR